METLALLLLCYLAALPAALATLSRYSNRVAFVSSGCINSQVVYQKLTHLCIHPLGTKTKTSFIGISGSNLNGRRIISHTTLHLAAQTTQSIDQLADDDLIAVPFDAYIGSITSSKNGDEATKSTNNNPMQLRLCVIRNAQYIYPLIRHEDDVETDLFLDPRCMDQDILLDDLIQYWLSSSRIAAAKDDDDTTTSTKAMADEGEVPYFGVGWYGQRPVPSLGGGPGYGAPADEIWSIEEDLLESLMEEGMVDIPVIDVGMAHGEKARGGALF